MQKSLFVTASFFIAAVPFCIAQGPALHYTVPSAAAPGKTTTVTFFGENLSEATALSTSFPAKVTRVSSSETNDSGHGKVAFQISVPKDVPVGIGVAQLATTNGVSDLRLVMIDDLPSFPKAGTNKTIASAQRLKLPLAVDGQTDELACDYYQFDAKKGQRVSVEVVANRLGSSLDPVARLLDARGKELVYCDDDPAVGSDSRLRFAAPATGQYIIELRDMSYQGGAKYRYRLRVGNFPLASAPFPLGVRQGALAKVTFLGRAVEGLRSISLRVPEDATQVPLNVKFPRGHGSGFVTLTTGRLPELLENEPNDTPEAATKIPVPAVINGRFARANDQDWFEFPANKDQRLLIAGRTRSLGSPCDLSMRLFNAAGKQLGEADISGANEGTLTNRFSEAGTYRLLVEELNRQGGPDLAYRIAVEPLEPGFTLSVETNRIAAAREGTFEIKIAATRHDYDGPITLSAVGPVNELVFEQSVIPEKKNEAVLKVTVPARVEAGKLFRFTIIGRAKMESTDIQSTASTMPALRRLFPLLRYPPRDLDGWIALGVTNSDSKPDTDSSKKSRQTP